MEVVKHRGVYGVGCLRKYSGLFTNWKVGEIIPLNSLNCMKCMKYLTLLRQWWAQCIIC